MDSFFAPAARKSRHELLTSYNRLQESALIREILDSLPYLVMVLNAQRQVVFVNQVLLDSLGLGGVQDWLGVRPGELLHCVNVAAGPGGCGTAKGCRYCGAVHVILDAMASGQKEVNECRIISHSGTDDTAFDLRVTAKPVQLSAQQQDSLFVLVSIEDISDEKRREVLERTFFHDVLNRVSVVQNSVQLLDDDLQDAAVSEEEREYLHLIKTGAAAIHDEIQRQRELIALENGTRECNITEVQTLPLLGSLVQQLLQLNRENPVTVSVDADAADNTVLYTDVTLLQRVLFNMLKNALEAAAVSGKSSPAVTVTTGYSSGGVRFTVTNDGYMTEEVQAQIFQRSFSTKGRGRGIGTWSMKLISEQYLGGRISFSSSKEHGTCFELLLPVER